MNERFGMAIRPPAFLSDDVARAIVRPPWTTVHAIARASGIPAEQVFSRIEPDVLAMAKALQARLKREGWPDSDRARRRIVEGAIHDALGPLRNQVGILDIFSLAAKGKSLAWLYGDEARRVLEQMLGSSQGINRVALSLFVQEGEGNGVVGAMIRRIDRPDVVVGESGDPDPAAPRRVGSGGDLVHLPRPSIPFSPRSAVWVGASPPPASASSPVTLARTSRWAEVSSPPPASVSGGGGEGAVVLFLLAVAVGSSLRP